MPVGQLTASTKVRCGQPFVGTVHFDAEGFDALICTHGSFFAKDSDGRFFLVEPRGVTELHFVEFVEDYRPVAVTVT